MKSVTLRNPVTYSIVMPALTREDYFRAGFRMAMNYPPFPNDTDENDAWKWFQSKMRGK